MKLTKTLTAALIWVTFSIPASAISDTPEYELKATISSMERALNDSNIQKLELVYADDAVLIPAQAGILNDKNAIVSFWHERFNNARSRYHIDVIHYRVDKNIAHLSALWSATVITPDMQSEVINGYLTNVMKRQPDGSWKIQKQSWD